MLNMDTMDDSENNAKISDSAYSNSCSNSQSRRSSKSTHSGSNSSGSSGYGGKPSTSGYSSTIQAPEKRLKEKENKKKKQVQCEKLTTDSQNETENVPEPAPVFESPKEDTIDVSNIPSTSLVVPEKGPEIMDVISAENTNAQDDVVMYNSADAPVSANASLNYVTSRPPSTCSDGFSCVISMHDGVVMYTTASLTTTLGFPKDMWVGRSFIEFVHPRDRNAFASQITNGLALPKNANGTNEKVQPQEDATMVCRIRRYRDLSAGFGIKSSVVTFMPFLLKLSFKSINCDEGDATYLVIQATPFFSAFKTPNEAVTKPVPFVIRHAANGNLEYLDPESVPYLGYLPQDVINKDALHLYHPGDLLYLRQIYETIVREGVSPRSRPYRMMAQNGDYVKLETEWSSFINPWSKKLEFVIGKHHIIEGPSNPDVFQSPELNRGAKFSEEEKLKAQNLRDNIVKILNEVLTKPAQAAKQQMTKRCQDLASFMETLLEDEPKVDEDIRMDMQEPDHSYYERDSVMLGGISPHHDYNDSKSSTETPVSYNQLNYNDTLQRYFESHPSSSYEDYNTASGENIFGMKEPSNAKERKTPMAGGSGNYDPHPKSNVCDYQHVRLTEALLLKHNAEMEKELVKMHRESRTSSKGERETSNEKRQKKKEHLARCNASFQPTSARMNTSDSQGSNKKAHGIKRMSKLVDHEVGGHKHHCPTPRQPRRRMPMTTAPPVAPPVTTPGMFPVHYLPAQQIASNTLVNQTPMSNNPGPSQPMPGYSGLSMAGTSMSNSMTGPISGHPLHGHIITGHPMASHSIAGHPISGHPMAGSANPVSGNANPMASSSTSAPGPSMPTNRLPTNHMPQPMPANPLAGNVMPGTSFGQFQAPAMECLMYGQAVYGAPFVYSAISPQVAYQMQQPCVSNAQGVQHVSPLGLASSNYMESTRAVRVIAHSNKAKAMRLSNSEDTIDKTDGESSYSSFYSSFFKTESGSAEESSDPKKYNTRDNKGYGRGYSPTSDSPELKKNARRKMEPPWMEHVCVSSELIYKYQVRTKSMEEVLLDDKEKMKTLEQPALVNEQLGQLYLDLQLEGVAARLTLEEGVTSSSSSGEETNIRVAKTRRKKREHSKLVMIYEENAPLPPPDSPTEGTSS